MIMVSDRQNPKIKVTVTPNEVKRGEMIRVSVSLSQIVPEIWMRILNKDQVIIQKPGLASRNSNGFTMMVGTKDLDEEHYTIQFSNHINFSPIGLEKFRVKQKRKSIIPIIPFLPFPFKNKDKPKGEFIQPDDLTEEIEIERLRFTTMKDSRVDPRCRELEDSVWDSDDPSLPEIPVHPNCRCWYEVIKSTVRNGAVNNKLMPIEVLNAVEVVRCVSVL